MMQSGEASDELFRMETSDEASDEASDEGILDNVRGGIGRVLNPVSAFTSLLNNQPAGVQNARLNTPQGSAQFRLPEPVVTERAFRDAMAKIDDNVNKLRVTLNRDRAAIQATSRRQDQLLQTMRKTVRKLEDRRQSDMWMGMLTTMLLQQQSHREVMSHVHVESPTGQGPVDSASVPTSNSAMMFMMLPMMMGGDDGMFGKSGSDGGGGGSMMTMMMMMMMMGSFKN